MIDIAKPVEDEERFRRGLQMADLAVGVACEALLEPLDAKPSHGMPVEPFPGQAWRVPILLETTTIAHAWVVLDGPPGGWPAGWIERLWRAVMNSVDLPACGQGVAIGVAAVATLPDDWRAAGLVPLLLSYAGRGRTARFLLDMELLRHLASCAWRHGWRHRCMVGRVMPLPPPAASQTGTGYGDLPVLGGELPVATPDDVMGWANSAFLTWQTLDRRCPPGELARLVALAMALDPETQNTPRAWELYGELERERTKAKVLESAADWWQCLRIRWAQDFCPESVIPTRFLAVPHQGGPAVDGLRVAAEVMLDGTLLGAVAVVLSRTDLAVALRAELWQREDPAHLLGLILGKLVGRIHGHAPTRLTLGTLQVTEATVPGDDARWTAVIPMPIRDGTPTLQICGLRLWVDAVVVAGWYGAIETSDGAFRSTEFRAVGHPVASTSPPVEPVAQAASNVTGTPSQSAPPAPRGPWAWGLTAGLGVALAVGWWIAGFVGNDGWLQVWAGAGVASAVLLALFGLASGLRPRPVSDRVLGGFATAFVSVFVIAGLGFAMNLFYPLQYRILAANPGPTPATLTIDGEPITVPAGAVLDIPIRHWVRKRDGCRIEHAGRTAFIDRSALLLAQVGERGGVGVNRHPEGIHDDAAGSAWRATTTAAMRAGIRVVDLPVALGRGLYGIGQPDTPWMRVRGDVSGRQDARTLISLDPPGETVVIDSYWEPLAATGHVLP